MARKSSAPPRACLPWPPVVDGGSMDRETHSRYLEYREKHGYFGGKSAMLGNADFAVADKELNELEALGEKRDDEEEVRYEELAKLLFRD
jgi:hypothetical protein